MLRTLWKKYIGLLFSRSPQCQVAALCYRHAGSGLQILVVTSRETRRWVLPKGWPKAGLDAAGAALEEAWEEAGVTPVSPRGHKIGCYRYAKRLDGGLPLNTDVHVFAFEVAGLQDSYPEVGQRERRWMSPDEAAAAVDEPDLQDLLRRASVLVRDLPAA